MATILVVDDERHIVRLLTLKLEEAGYVVLPAYDGNHAIEVLSATKPDLVILDIALLTVDGEHVLEFMRRDAELAKIPVVIHTGLTSVCHERPYDVAAYWEKPMTCTNFAEEVAKILTPQEAVPN